MDIGRQLGQEHPQHRHLRPVEKQGVSEHPQHGGEHIEGVVGPVRLHHVAHRVLHRAEQQGVHRAPHQGAQGPGQKAPGDLDVVYHGERIQPGQRDAGGDHQGGEDHCAQLFGVSGGALPVGVGEGRFEDFHEKRPPLRFGSTRKPGMPHKGSPKGAIPPCGSGMRRAHCKPCGFSSGGQLPVPPALVHTRSYSACRI